MNSCQTFLGCSDLLKYFLETNVLSAVELLNLRLVHRSLKDEIDKRYSYVVNDMKSDSLSYVLQWVLHNGDKKLANVLYRQARDKKFFTRKLYDGILCMFQKLDHVDDDQTLSLFRIPILHCLENLLNPNCVYWKDMWKHVGKPRPIYDCNSNPDATYSGKYDIYYESEIRLREFFIQRLELVTEKLSFRNVFRFFFSGCERMSCHIPSNVFHSFRSYISENTRTKLGNFVDLSMCCAQNNFEIFMEGWKKFEESTTLDFRVQHFDHIVFFPLLSQNPDILEFVYNQCIPTIQNRDLWSNGFPDGYEVAYHVLAIQDETIRNQFLDTLIQKEEELASTTRHIYYISRFYVYHVIDLEKKPMPLVFLLEGNRFPKYGFHPKSFSKTGSEYLRKFTEILLSESKTIATGNERYFVLVLLNSLCLLHEQNLEKEHEQSLIECIDKVIPYIRVTSYCRPNQFKLDYICSIIVERIFANKIQNLSKLDERTRYILDIFLKLLRLGPFPTQRNLHDIDVFHYHIVFECLVSLNLADLMETKYLRRYRDRQATFKDYLQKYSKSCCVFIDVWKDYRKPFDYLQGCFKSRLFRDALEYKDLDHLSPDQIRQLGPHVRGNLSSKLGISEKYQRVSKSSVLRKRKR